MEPTTQNTAAAEPAPRHRERRRARKGRGRLGAALAAAGVGLGTALLAAALVSSGTPQLTAQPVAAQDDFQRGPDPTVESVAAEGGTFDTEEVGVEPGHGFNGGTIYYPTDTSLGTWGAVAVVPGYTASWDAEGAWMGHWIASFGFVVIGIDTNSPTDWDDARGDQLLAALDYLVQDSPVADRVDPDRLGVMGHSMGGGGAINAAMQRPDLQAAVPFAPASFSQDLSNVQVPTLVIGAEDDDVITPGALDQLYASLPGGTPGGYVQYASGGHGFPTYGNSNVTRLTVPWLKIFIDNDTRYTQFLCPEMADTTNISRYENTCPYDPVA
jgi:pimeloyl-ACP methyl ester carboxylesterase